MIDHILLDMDGVLVQWNEAVCELLGKPGLVVDRFKTAECLGISNDEMWESIDDIGADFWANLKPYSWTDELLELVGGFPWTIATAYAQDETCSQGKHRWLNNRFGRNFEGMMIGKRKWLMAGPGRVLIDDREKNVIDFDFHGGFGILFPQPWNENRHLCDRRMEYVRDQLEMVEND